MVKKRGQAAMEFLMTYGWALLVVLVAIGALAFFGVLNPARFLPETCTITPGLACTDFKADGTASTLTIMLQNGMGKDLTDVNVTSSSCTAPVVSDLNDGNTATLTCTLAGFTQGDRYKGLDNLLVLGYTEKDSGIPHSVPINLITEVQ